MQLRVDVIVAGGGRNAALTAKEATSTTPIVVPMAADPVAAGLVVSLARQGGNVTGLSMLNTEISAKRLDVLRAVLPRIGGLPFCAGRPPRPGGQVLEGELAVAADEKGEEPE